MKVTNIVNIDLSIRQNIPFVDAVQGDSARAIEFRLFDKGQPFNAPDGSAVLIRYKRPDGFGGVYDTLPNGETAYSISANKVTAVLSPTALGAPGEVDFQISILSGDDLISIFSLQIRVDKDPYIDSSEAEDYVNITGVSSNEIAISSTAPTDDKVKLWINPDEVEEEDEGSDSTLLVVTFTTDENGKHTPSHTYDQIKEWLDNGGSAVLTNGNQWYNLAFMNASTVWFERTVAMSTGTQYVRYVITAMGQMTKTEDKHKLVNVTAEVGQTIIVKEVDEKGKPTKWEAVDYQPRTHWSEVVQGDLVPYTVFKPILNPTLQMPVYMLPEFGLAVGKTYTVVYDGVEYPCTAVSGTLQGLDFVSIGNTYLATGTPTSEPFIVAKIPSLSATLVINLAETEAPYSIQIIGEKTVYHKPAPEYAPNEYRVSFMETGVVSDEGSFIYQFSADWDELIAAIKAGKNIYADLCSTKSSGGFYTQRYMLGFALIGNTPADNEEYTDKLMFGVCHNSSDEAINDTVWVLRWQDGTVTVSNERIWVKPA